MGVDYAAYLRGIDEKAERMLMQKVYLYALRDSQVENLKALELDIPSMSVAQTFYANKVASHMRAMILELNCLISEF